MSEERAVIAGTPAADEIRAAQRRSTDDEHGPIDPDVDLAQPSQRDEWTAHRWVLPTISVGGMLGASARHGIEIAWPVGAGGIPWATFATNIGGCTLIGLLMVYLVDLGAGHPLLRPFVGVGILGGFTTFSTYAVQTTELLDGQEPALALGYLFGTIAAALVAVVSGIVLGRVVLALVRRRARSTRYPKGAVR